MFEVNAQLKSFHSLMTESISLCVCALRRGLPGSCRPDPAAPLQRLLQTQEEVVPTEGGGAVGDPAHAVQERYSESREEPDQPEERGPADPGPAARGLRRVPV